MASRKAFFASPTRGDGGRSPGRPHARNCKSFPNLSTDPEQKQPLGNSDACNSAGLWPASCRMPALRLRSWRCKTTSSAQKDQRTHPWSLRLIYWDLPGVYSHQAEFVLIESSPAGKGALNMECSSVASACRAPELSLKRETYFCSDASLTSELGCT